MIGVPPISYLLPKLMHVYSLRLQRMPSHALICTILVSDWCRYWPKYFIRLTNLSHASNDVGPSTYCPSNLCTARLWVHPCLTYSPDPSPGMLATYKAALIHLALSDMHIFITY